MYGRAPMLKVSDRRRTRDKKFNSQTDNLKTQNALTNGRQDRRAKVNLQPHQVPPPEDFTWSCVEDGFYVASYGNTFLGFVDRIDTEVFQVCDATSQQIGIFSTFEVAQVCLTARAQQAHTFAKHGTEE